MIHTLPSPSVRFGLVADLHYSTRLRWQDRFYSESLAKLTTFVNQMNLEDVAFLVQLGDLKDVSEPPNRTDTLALLKEIDQEFRRFRGPRHHVLGNHDLDELTKSDFYRITGATMAPYAFRSGGIQFLVLDACFRPDGAEYANGDFDWTQSLLPAGQLDWLEAILSESEGPCIVFSHQRLDDEPPYSVVNAHDVRSVLESSRRVLAVFQGHDHRGSLSCIDGIHYYTLAGAVEGTGPGSHSFALAEVEPDLTIRIAGYGRARSVVLVATGSS